MLGFDLVDKAGFTLKSGLEQAAYNIILCTMTQNSIYECNEMLRAMNVRTLSKEE